MGKGKVILTPFLLGAPVERPRSLPLSGLNSPEIVITSDCILP